MRWMAAVAVGEISDILSATQHAAGLPASVREQ